MSTVNALNLANVTLTTPTIFNCRGANNLQITISPPSTGAGSGVYLQFARRVNGMTGGFEIAEFHGFELLSISDEEIDAVQYYIANASGSAVLTIIATT